MPEGNLPQRFLRMCRSHWKRPKIADGTGAALTGGELLLRTLVLRRILRREVFGAEEPYVGLLLPPSAGAAMANAAIALDRRIAVNLNYTASAEVVQSCIQRCGIRHVLTSRKMIQRLSFSLNVPLVYLDDLPQKATRLDKALAALAAIAIRVLPPAAMDRWFGLHRIAPDDLLTVIFTSGTTGQPKGVMLTQRNIGSNIDAFNEILGLRPDDVLMAILPFFHSFGYTGTLWTVLTMAPKGVYHVNPIDARKIGELCREHKATILVATPTFLRPYMKRCAPEDFATLEVVFVGAEKLPSSLADAFEEKFKVRPHEGYGATELSPVAAGNIPPARGPGAVRQGARHGTVGRPLPGMEAKVVDVDTGEDLGTDKPGLLLFRGPNVMKGYLDQPDATAKVLTQNGWYRTGDMAVIDADGFIRITDRLSRFSKIGGEMVPHVRVEEAILKIVAAAEDARAVAVAGVPDAKKGERLIVLHTGLSKPPEQIVRELAQEGLPPLWIPSPDSFVPIEALPVLGTGKLDLQRVKQIAAAHAQPA